MSHWRCIIPREEKTSFVLFQVLCFSAVIGVVALAFINCFVLKVCLKTLRLFQKYRKLFKKTHAWWSRVYCTAIKRQLTSTSGQNGTANKLTANVSVPVWTHGSSEPKHCPAHKTDSTRHSKTVNKLVWFKQTIKQCVTTPDDEIKCIHCCKETENQQVKFRLYFQCFPPSF